MRNSIDFGPVEEVKLVVEVYSVFNPFTPKQSNSWCLLPAVVR